MSETRKVELASRYGPDVSELYEMTLRICKTRGHDLAPVDLSGYDGFECLRCQEQWVPKGLPL